MLLKVGQTASLSKTFQDSDIQMFADLSLDTNPIHLDDVYAHKTRFGRRIVHGMLIGGLISAVLGTQLPGPGAIYIQQTLKFRAPVFLGDTVTATAEMVSIRPDKPIVTLDTICRNQSGLVVVEGEATLLVPTGEEH
jgi:3-hydroxybutyryl-CoA dehydratase